MLDGSDVANEAHKPLPATIALTRAYNAQVQGNLATAVKYAEQAIQLIPENDYYRRSQAAITLECTTGPAATWRRPSRRLVIGWRE